LKPNLRRPKNYFITSAQQLAALILSEPLKHAGIKGAAIYGVSLLTGVAILPVAVVATFAGKDNAQQDINAPIDHLYEISLEVLKRKGKITKEQKSGGLIEAVAEGANVNSKLKSVSANTAHITISARKYMLPKPEIASGILYQVSEQLQK